jgi:hypothetical protein
MGFRRDGIAAEQGDESIRHRQPHAGFSGGEGFPGRRRRFVHRAGLGESLFRFAKPTFLRVAEQACKGGIVWKNDADGRHL